MSFTNMEEYHKSVLIKEVLEYLNPRQGDEVVDATFGFGGHSKEILQHIGNKGRLIAIEQDEDIIELVKNESTDKRISIVNENFLHLASILKSRKIKKVDKILFDLGLSSYHFDTKKSGFSFNDPTLDMRLDKKSVTRASDLVNSLPEKDLADLLFKNADEYYSRRIAKAIVEKRKTKKITSAKELAAIISATVRKRGRTNSATKTFQALRIEVNNELGVLEKTLPVAINHINKGGRIAVISFHSKEDKIVKETFKKFASLGKIKLLTKKPVVATYEETKQNPRSRSAKLRAAEIIN
ncbi:MAG: 16S rRNA (cytosine(1402)-N(4))-methyltransferase RsmH [bacterium]